MMELVCTETILTVSAGSSHGDESILVVVGHIARCGGEADEW